MTRQRTIALLTALSLLSFGLRVWGLAFGLPFEYHPDEQQYILPAVGVVGGNFEPHAHYNPTLYPYFIGLIFSAVYWGLRFCGAFPQFFTLEAAWSDPMLPWTSGMIFLARYITAGVGVLTMLMVYQLGRRAYSRPTGLGAALIFGASFLPAREAHFAVNDAPVALGVTVTLYFCVGILRHANRRAYLLAGLALGLATATKYSAALLAIPIAAAHLLSRAYPTRAARWRHGGRLVGAGLLAVGVYALISPYTFIQWPQFWADFSENLESARSGFQGLELDPAGGAWFYLKVLGWGFGWPLTGLFFVSVTVLLGRHRRIDLFMLLFPLFGLWYMQRQEMFFARWLMPFLPPLTVCAAETLSLTSQQIGRRLSRPWPRLALGMALLLTLPSTAMATYGAFVFNQPDTRTLALHWIQTHVPPNSGLAAEILSPPWGPPLAMPGLRGPTYRLAPIPDGGVSEVSVAQLQAWGVEYVVASSFHYARQLRDKEHQARLAANYAALQHHAELLVQFSPYHTPYEGYFYHDQVFGPANDLLYRTHPGPVITIYRLR